MMQVSAEKTWTAAQHQLRSMLNADTYNLWFAPLRAHGLETDCLVLEVANDFCEVWLKDNYLGLLQEVLTRTSGKPTLVKFKVVLGNNLPVAATIAPAPRTRPVEAAPEKAPSDPGFNPKNTFDTFVVGNNNNFAH